MAKSRAPLNWQDALARRDYAALQNNLLIHVEALDGIQAHVVTNDTNFPTGSALIRDASNRAAEKYPVDHIYVKADNLLLRLLTIACSIDHVFQYKAHERPEKKDIFAKGQNEIQKKLSALFNKVENLLNNTTIDPLALKNLEIEFNTDSIKLLRETDASLIAGLTTAKDFEKLLLFYRDMASTLDPAKSIQTIVNDNTIRKNKLGDDIKTQHIETAHPITGKTVNQQACLRNALKTQQKNFYSEQKPAFKEVYRAFVELIADNTRRLPPQTRKSIPVSVKNGYLVENQLKFTNLTTPGVQVEKSHSLRGGSLAYVGKGENEATIVAHTKDNLLQLQQAAATIAKTKIHTIILLTNHKINIDQQREIINAIKTAEKSLNSNGDLYDFSNIATNLIGQTAPPELPTEISKYIDLTTSRYELAANTANKANQANNTISFVMCASGMDRTGTVEEFRTELWSVTAYAKQGITVTRSDIEDVRAEGAHNATIATAAAPGSPGMKTYAAPRTIPITGDILFLPSTNERLYRVTANTNKSAPGNYNTSDNQKLYMQQTYEECMNTIKQYSSSEELQAHAHLLGDLLRKWANAAIAYQTQKDNPKFTGKISSLCAGYFQKSVSPQETKKIRDEATNLLKQLELFDDSIRTQQIYILDRIIDDIKQSTPEKKQQTVFKYTKSLVDAVKEKYAELDKLFPVGQEQARRPTHSGP